jgi:hypothetical protein
LGKSQNGKIRRQNGTCGILLTRASSSPGSRVCNKKYLLSLQKSVTITKDGMI